MKLNRRRFISTGLTAGLATSLPAASCSSRPAKTDYSKLDEILKQPVFKKQLFPSPVIIDTLELLRYRDSFLCRVRSKDGAEGISVGHSAQFRSQYPIFVNLLQPFFINKDARELDLILEKVLIYRLNFRLGGIAIGVPLAAIEFAILDMMGRISGNPMGELFGEIHNPEVGVYQATEFRDRPVEESIGLISRAVAENNAKALKIKVGTLMYETTDMYAVGPKGRTEEIIPRISKLCGDKLTLYADANGFFSVEEAIKTGRLLEEHNIKFFEEPVPFDWYEETKQVADALNIPIAGGEQEYGLHGFRWLIANDGLQVVQPDTNYFGGMIRSMRVALMAHAYGKGCTPHISGGDLGYLYMMHFVSVIPNALEFHEFKGFRTNVVFECKTSSLKIVDGKIKVPTGPGLGVEIDPDFISKHEVVKA